ncbi:MAG: DUF2892 domain-containing protein [Candidatus Moraniibacteriota bacterium]|nr:MAG: DUF2892 domain-containing protein [Candidatus Moranbacteria bacterium]
MKKNAVYRMNTRSWHVERTVFLIAGFFILTAETIAFFLSPSVHFFTIMVGGMLVFFATTGYCPLAILIDQYHRRKTSDSSLQKDLSKEVR